MTTSASQSDFNRPRRSRRTNPADPNMPAEFSPLLDREHMGRLLAGLIDPTLRIGYCAIEHVRLKQYLKPASARKAWINVSYHLSLTTAHETIDRIFLAKAFLDGRGRREHENLSVAQRAKVHYIAQHDMLVWCFPCDPEMPWLETMLDPDTNRHFLPWSRLQAIGIDAENITTVRTRVLHYHPEQRCLIRFRLERGDGLAAGADLYARSYADDVAEQVCNRMLHHWTAGGRAPGRFIVARPLGWSQRLQTVWQQSLPADSLHEALQGDQATPLVRALAIALAGFHREDGADEPPRRRGHHYEETAEKLNKLKQAYPEYGARLTHLHDQVRAEADSPGLAPPRLVHNRLHLRRLGIHQQRIALFDFDDFRCGDPTQDIADLVVDLLQFDPDIGTRQIHELTRSYVRHCDWTPEAANLAWHTRNKLIAKAYRTHLQRAPRTAVRVAYLIEQARSVGRWDLGLGVGHRLQRQ